MKDKARGDIAGVQYLRGLAACMVVLFHLSVQLSQLAGENRRLTNLNAGVDIFFVISGFVMVYSTRGGTRLPAGTFLRRRLERIVPLYWLVTLGVAALLLLAPGAAKQMRLEPWLLAASLLFWPALNPVGHVYLPLIPLGWTLNLEMFFYAIFAAAIAIGARRSRRVMPIAVSALITCATLGFAAPAIGPPGFYLDPILLEFVYGMALALLFARMRPLRAATGLAIAAIGMAVLLALPFDGPAARPFAFGLPAVAIFVGIAFADLPVRPLLHRLGDVSYSLYLSHYVVVSAFAQIWRRVAGVSSPAGVVGFYLGGAAAALTAGYLCWRLIERPILDRLRDRRTPAAAGIGASHLTMRPATPSCVMPSARER